MRPRDYTTRRGAASALIDGASHPDGALLPCVVRVLFAYEDTHLSYRDTFVRVVRTLRPRLAVTAVGMRSLESEVRRLEPHLVVSSRPDTFDRGGGAAWYKLSPEPDEPSEVCLGGRRSRTWNPGLNELVAVIDEVEEAIRVGRPPGTR